MAAAATSSAFSQPGSTWSIGPNSHNNNSSSNSNAVPWDEQVVPALRKQLEAESAQISKRLSRMDSDRLVGKASLERQPSDYRAGARASPQYDQNQLGTSHYGGPTRAASTRGLNIAARQWQDESRWSPSGNAAGSSVEHRGPRMETEKAREKARMLRERKRSTAAAGPAVPGQAALGQVSLGVSYNTASADSPSRSQRSSQPDAVGSSRSRTQSTPMRYIPPPRETVGLPAMPSRAGRAERTPGDQQSTPLCGAAAQGERGPRWPSEPPASHQKLRSATHGEPAQKQREERPSAAMAAGMSSRSTRAVTEPPPDTNGAGLWDWDEVLPPTIARRVAQEELLKRDPSLQDVNGLIDTWDKSGLPLTQKMIQAMAEKSTSGADNVQSDEPDRGQSYTSGLDDEDASIPSPGRNAAVESREQRLSQLVDGMALYPRKGVHSPPRQDSHQSRHPEQQARYPPTFQDAPPRPIPSSAAASPAVNAGGRQQPAPVQHPEEEHAGCCKGCLVM
ncbi:unnamed protein product [Parajaminaea phylloscopi]